MVGVGWRVSCVALVPKLYWVGVYPLFVSDVDEGCEKEEKRVGNTTCVSCVFFFVVVVLFVARNRCTLWILGL